MMSLTIRLPIPALSGKMANRTSPMTIGRQSKVKPVRSIPPTLIMCFFMMVTHQTRMPSRSARELSI